MPSDSPLKIGLTLDLVEIVSVIESLPAGHPLLPMLHGKMRVLLAAERMRKANLSAFQKGRNIK